MTEDREKMYRYRILRYMPNLVRDEWLNIGVLLEEPDAERREIKLVEESRDLIRIRQLHPSADQDFLRSLPGEFDALLRAPDGSEGTRKTRSDPLESPAMEPAASGHGGGFRRRA